MDDIAEPPSTEYLVMNDMEKMRDVLAEFEGFSPSQDMVASLFQNYKFDHKIVSSLTPIKKGEAIDCPIYRPQGMAGWIINLTIKGTGRIYFLNGEYRQVKQGDLCLFPPNIAHHYGRCDDDEYWYHRWIYFHPYRQWANILKWRELSHNIYFMHIKDQDYTDVENIFEQLLHENIHAKLLSFEITLNLLEYILLKCRQIDQNTMQWKQMNPKILKACIWITEHLKDNFTLQELAEYVALSPSQLSHLFKQQVGYSVMNWKHHQIINQAAIDLRQTDEKISQIGLKYGFDDPLYFSRFFKKLQGVNPTKYRRLWKKT
ncbi:MAG: arabinose operon transcriptional regulator AraC [Alphaproteobacteria bacterium]